MKVTVEMFLNDNQEKMIREMLNAPKGSGLRQNNLSKEGFETMHSLANLGLVMNTLGVWILMPTKKAMLRRAAM